MKPLNQKATKTPLPTPTPPLDRPFKGRTAGVLPAVVYVESRLQNTPIEW
jgi:hypothetical protein